MNSHHLSDKEIKTALGKFDKIKELGRKLPDWCIKSDNNIWCIEYENSSRGCLWHTAKYIKLAKEHNDCDFVIFVIRSLHHQAQHKVDYELAQLVYSDIALPNLHINFMKCKGTIDYILEIKNSCTLK